MPLKNLYGLTWKTNDRLEIEFYCVRKGGQWKHNGKIVGAGLAEHYLAIDRILWPEDKIHRWYVLLTEEYCKTKCLGIMGAASTGKTNFAAKMALKNYFIWPKESTSLVSSTDLRGLDLRIWGEIKKYFLRAKERRPELPGHIIESRRIIATDDIETEEVRDIRNGIIAVPCIVNNTFVGLGKFVGIKNKHVFLYADELQFMGLSLLDSMANLATNPDFRVIAMGNPKDTMDALGKFCEPADELGGWPGVGEPEKTTVWDTRFMSGRCVNLVGTDSPNFDVPEDERPPYPFLISRKTIQQVVDFWGKDSLQYYMTCKGVMKPGVEGRRIITRQMCVKHQAFEPVQWADENRTLVYAIDASCSGVGGDRTVAGEIEFGLDVRGQMIISVSQPRVVPFSLNTTDTVEEQIVKFVMDDCRRLSIPPERVYYDSTGRGALGVTFARLWSPHVNPIEFAGSATDRRMSPTSSKTAKDLYSKFVTELWFFVRLVIESNQLRNLPEEVAAEGAMREWKVNRTGRIEIETKEETKARMGRSPDLFDWLVIAVEGARRLGFKLQRPVEKMHATMVDDWLNIVKTRKDELLRSRELNYAA